MEREPHWADAPVPAEIARKVERLGVAKAQTDTVTLLVLAALAGAFISLGALFFTVVMTEAGLGFGVTRLLGGLSFCLGLVLVVVAGAELFTGNNLLAVAWASGLIGTRDVMRNWLIVYVGNVIGCLGTVMFVVWADIAGLGDGNVGETAIQIARAKAGLRWAKPSRVACSATPSFASRSGSRWVGAAWPTRSWRFSSRSPPS